MAQYLLYLKNEYPFLRDVHSQPLQLTLQDLDLAYRRALSPTSRARFPRYKRKGSPQGIRFPQWFKIDGSGIYLPKIGWIGFRKSRDIEGTPKNVTVSFDGHNWFVAIQTEREVPSPAPSSKSAVGIDLGIARFAALSDGTFLDGPNPFKSLQQRLAFLQRRVERKIRFSKNWRKEQAKIARIRARIRNIRVDFLHKSSTTICKSHAYVAMERLQLVSMTKSAKGSVEHPGSNVRAKSSLNRRILDQGWGEFRRQIGYKLAWAGGQLRLVDPKNTSRTCGNPGCQHVAKNNRKAQAEFVCIRCGYAANADTNAAMEILKRAGWARIACGDLPLGGSLKQEARRTK